MLTETYTRLLNDSNDLGRTCFMATNVLVQHLYYSPMVNEEARQTGYQFEKYLTDNAV